MESKEATKVATKMAEALLPLAGLTSMHAIVDINDPEPVNLQDNAKTLLLVSKPVATEWSRMHGD